MLFVLLMQFPFKTTSSKLKDFIEMLASSIEETDDVQGRLDRMDFTLHSFLNRHLG
jgi:hypothetical protein